MISAVTFGQSVMPSGRSFKSNGKYYLTETSRSKISAVDSATIKKKISDSFPLVDFFRPNKQVELYSYRLYAAASDSISAVSAKQETQRIIDTLNSTPPVKILASGGLSNLENIKQAYGSLSLGLLFRLSKYKAGINGWIDPIYAYVMFNTKSATSPDSSSIQKTFLFPELNKRDFVIGFYRECSKNGWNIAPLFEFSLNRFNDTSNKKTFVSQCFLGGVRMNKSFQLSNPNITTFLQVLPYFSLINVDPKYSEDFRFLTKEPNNHGTYYSLGLQTSIQAENLILFCNMKYILNKSNGIQSPDLVRFVYTVGTQLTL